METAKFYLDKFYTKFYYNYVVWKLEILCWKFYVVWKLCIIKFYAKFYYNYVVWKLPNFIMIDFIFIGE